MVQNMVPLKNDRNLSFRDGSQKFLTNIYTAPKVFEVKQPLYTYPLNLNHQYQTILVHLSPDDILLYLCVLTLSCSCHEAISFTETNPDPGRKIYGNTQYHPSPGVQNKTLLVNQKAPHLFDLGKFQVAE